MKFLSSIFGKLRANNSYDAETNEECENPPSVALNAQAEIVLFGSVDAASEISWTLRGCWDGCNGVTFATRDHVAIDTAAKLLKTEFCQAGDYCHQEKRNIEEQYLDFQGVAL